MSGPDSQPNDPILGVDIGTNTTFLGGITPDGTDRIVVERPDTNEPMFPTRALWFGEETRVGHETTTGFDGGLPTANVMQPFDLGRERYEEALEASGSDDPGEPLRRRYFEYLYEQIDAQVDGWEGRVALPVRPARVEDGRALLEAYLEDAGFEIVRRVDNHLATAIGYWEYDRHGDPHVHPNEADETLVLTADIGSKYHEFGLVSVRGHEFRELAVKSGERETTIPETYARSKAGIVGSDIEDVSPAHRFKLLNGVYRHFPELARGEVDATTFKVPEEFGGTDGETVELRSSEVYTIVNAIVDDHERTMTETLESADLHSLHDVDIVLNGGFSSTWLVLLKRWQGKGFAVGNYTDPGAIANEDSDVRVTSGLVGKFLAGQGASMLAQSETGRSEHDITVVR